MVFITHNTTSEMPQIQNYSFFEIKSYQALWSIIMKTFNYFVCSFVAIHCTFTTLHTTQELFCLYHCKYTYYALCVCMCICMHAYVHGCMCACECVCYGQTLNPLLYCSDGGREVLLSVRMSSSNRQSCRGNCSECTLSSTTQLLNVLENFIQ